MFGIGFWELTILLAIALLIGGAAIAALIIALTISANSKNRGPDER